MSAILRILDRHQHVYRKSGSSIVTRCPACKGDQKINEHNAQVNTDTNTIYCYTEQKVYTYAELLRILEGRDVDSILQKRKRISIENTEKTRNQPKLFEEVRNNLLNRGYHISAVYEYYDVNGDPAYIRYRFQRENERGEVEKIILPRSLDGYASMMGKKQIPYGLHQFLYIYPEEIWICEGEKCADALISRLPEENIVVLGYTKASDFQGYENLAREKNVVIFQDNDSTGEKNTKELVEMLKSHAQTIRVVKFHDHGPGYDVADFLGQYDMEDLSRKIESSEVVYQSPIQCLVFGKKKFVRKPDPYILEPFLPSHSVILFDGLGESGKSLFALQMCMCLASGKPFLGLDVKEKRKVLYCTAEETDYDFQERIEKIQKALGISDDGLENLAWISTLSSDFPCSTYSLLEETGKSIEKTEFYDFLLSIVVRLKPTLVVLDSMANFFGLEENSSRHALKFFESLKMISKNHECSFLLLHHQAKEAMRKDGEKMFRGSSVFREQARCRFYMEKLDDYGTKRIVIEKLNKSTAYSREYYVRLLYQNGTSDPSLCLVPVIPNTIPGEKNDKKTIKM